MGRTASKRVYCMGFLFHEHSVALIYKRHGPKVVLDKWNGIGGGVERHEPVDRAMVREFQEETGNYITGWIPFGYLDVHAYNARIYLFKKFIDERVPLLQTTDEEVSWFDYRDVLAGDHRVVPNLHWLIPLALAKDQLTVCITDNT